MKIANLRVNPFLFLLSLILIVAVLKWPGIQASADAAWPRERIEVESQDQPQGDLDATVRGDFFAGMKGNKSRLDRAMKYTEDILAKNPKHGEALVWHGGGLLVRAVHAYTKGDNASGDKLWKEGLEEMNRAAILEPQSLKIKIGRGATLIGYAQSGWDPTDRESRVLLESALLDYETVYGWQKPYFSKVPMHSRGELLFGLASGWSILGNDTKAREYLRLVLTECKDSPYEALARRWLAKKWPVVVQHDCIGCHHSKRSD